MRTNHSAKIHVTLNAEGAITIPDQLRRSLGLRAGERLLVEVTPEGLLLRPVATAPIEFYTDERIQEFAADEAAIEERLRESD